MSVLVATAWWPTKTPHFAAYARGISAQLEEGDELFIATSLSGGKFESIVSSMALAERYALDHGFSHVFNVEADIELKPGTLRRLLALSYPVVVAAHSERDDMSGGPGTFKSLVDQALGWNVLLAHVDVLRRVPFAQGFQGDYMTPDRIWFKRILREEVPVWIDTETRPRLLEPAETRKRLTAIGGQ